MASSSGLMQRRKGPNVSRGSSDGLNQGERRSSENKRTPPPDFADDDYDEQESRGIASGSDRPSSGQQSRARGNDRQAYDDNDASSSDNTSSSRLRLTLMEEVLLLGLKDKQGYLSFWNDNISYVLRGTMLMELALRGRIQCTKQSRSRAGPDRTIQVINDRNTSEVLLDECIKYIKLEEQSIANWIDLLSGETWNLMKIGFQLKQVRERLAKGLVDKGVLRTEKKNFLLFDMATHPVADPSVKAEIVKRVVDALLGQGAAPDQRTLTLICAAYAANVIENAFSNLPHTTRETCFNRADDLLKRCGTGGSDSGKINDVVSGVLSVFCQMDRILL